MRILWVATKAPWPTRDGGRVLAANTLRALASQGHDVTLVSPFDPRSEARDGLAAGLREFCRPHLVAFPPRGQALAFLRSRYDGVPMTIGRHACPAVRRQVERLLAGERFDVVHAEQLQALPQCAPGPGRAPPIVLRAQNVETDLWSGLAASRPALRRLAQAEARRLARYEGRAVRAVAVTIALTARDGERLRTLSAGAGAVEHVPAPFPESLPPGPDQVGGEPAVIVLGGGWLPNRDGAAAFMAGIWPHVQARCPGAILHVFGMAPRVRGAGRIECHRAPPESAAAFPPRAILAVPLWIASGVRIKILEAWARGVPVVATPEAAAGLDATEGAELLVARNAPEFAAAIERYHLDPAFARATIEAGRALLRRHHDPRRIAERLADVYGDAAGRSRG